MTLIEFTVPSFKVRITYGTLCIAIAAAWLLYEFVDSAGVAGAIVLAACAGIGAAAGLIYYLCSDLLLCALDALGSLGNAFRGTLRKRSREPIFPCAETPLLSSSDQ
jgi:hypothetical protein